ncbi:hypothetical protein MVEN_01460600 [Mycena venus]|uniref:F-box domain-containing protein n=1 Tax=Mycena venus TaxID=2733690 RepID=A0A8H7CTP5_9AGAR|nr:hypothetical protein MVEN_01460600 [Mycena venus]
MDLVIPQCQRWRSVHFLVDRACVLNWLRPLNGRLDQLQRLEVERFGYYGAGTMFPDVFSTAPNLREIIGMVKSIQIPWGQVTRYRADQYFDVPVSSTLVQLDLWNCTLQPGLVSVLSRLPNLRHLLLGDNSSLEHARDLFFHSMTIHGVPTDLCPNLTSLIYGYASPWLQNVFFDMVQSRFRSYGPGRLTSLRIFNLENARMPPPQDMVDQTKILQNEGFDAVFLGERDVERMRERAWFRKE